MGKSLKGKELGIGITQRKDGRYSAKFKSKSGKRIEKYFEKLAEARKWLSEATGLQRLKLKQCAGVHLTAIKIGITRTLKN